MAYFSFIVSAVMAATPAIAKDFALPEGKGTCPAITFQGDATWTLKSDRAGGDRWVLLDSKKNAVIARFDYRLESSDQKQLPEVESKELTLASFKIQKVTVTTDMVHHGEADQGAHITAYYYLDGKLNGLVVMSGSYQKTAKLDQKIEGVLKTLKLKAP